MEKNDIPNQIKRLVENRKIEAIGKNIPEKMVCIAKNLGKPVISNGLFGNKVNDVFSQMNGEWIYDVSKIYDADETSDGHEVGYYFDGLRFGVNLCITIKSDNPMYSEGYSENKVYEIKASYNGFVVFAQIEGDIKAYAPFPAWEDQLNMFNDSAELVERRNKKEQNEENKRNIKEKYKDLWNKLKDLWNIGN
jgi:hypothetical protein